MLGRSHEEGNDTHSSVLVWEIPWIGEAVGPLDSLGCLSSWYSPFFLTVSVSIEITACLLSSLVSLVVGVFSVPLSAAALKVSLAQDSLLHIHCLGTCGELFVLPL